MTFCRFGGWKSSKSQTPNRHFVDLVFGENAMFIGREKELEQLQQIVKKKIASLIVVKIQRRIGKSRLIEEFGKSFSECEAFWGKQTKRVSAFEKLKVLSITGGIPRYLEEIDPKASAENNIQRLCFNPSGLLFNEFDSIFSDLFSKRDVFYKDILYCIAEGLTTVKNISEKLARKKVGISVKNWVNYAQMAL